MSRRKQANPRPLKAQEEEAIGQVAKGKCYAMVAKFEEFNENHDSDQDLLEYDEYAPLVVDTSRPPESDDEHDNHGQDQDRLQTTEADIGSFNHCDQDPGPVNVSTGELIKSLSTNAVLNQDQSNSSSEHDQLFIDSAAPSEISNNSRTPSISSLSDQLSPGGLSSSLSASKVHRRGKRILPVASEGGENRYICPICQQVLSSSHDLTVHIRSHNSSTTANQANSCTICGKVLSSQSSLDRHMLVHSGERPFQCKICKMSFTTNGNMHRHARIHAKENDVNGIGPKVNRSKPKPPNWKSRMNFFSSPGAPSGLDVQQLTSPFRREFTAPSVGVSDSPVASTEVLTQGIKRSFNFINYTQEWPSSPAKQKCLPHNFTPPELPSTNHMTTSNYCNEVSTSSAKPQSEEVVVPDVKTQEQKSTVDGEETNVDQLHCPVCNKTFLCKYGLETHLETHPNFSMKCNFCHMSFPTPRGLNMHKLMVHSKDKSTEEENDKKNDLKCATVGFYDLSFMDFSVNKFSLVAKAWCEENARKSSSAFHNFQCKECAKAFPSKSSLLLHTNTHSTEKTAKCPLCECDFLDSSILHQHMLKHLSDKAFNDVMIKRKKEIVNSSPAKTDKIGKHDFLASFGLTTVSEAEILERKERGMKKESLIKMEKKENNEYFAKLGQVFSPDVSPIHPMLRKGLNLSPEEQAKSVMDLHKILQSSAGLTGLGQQGHIPGAETAGLNANNAKAFLPAMLPINIANSTNDLASLGNLTTLAAIMNSNPMFLSAMLANQSFSSPLPTPPPSSESGSGSSGEMSDKYANKSGLFQCKYCDQVFTNYRQLKGHTRTHLGLSPYKCNLCNYSSADKSTLIRHLRTHNGERPFMCRVCDFAFTTKANCERHVRKKHGKYMKEDIDAAIGYNKYVAESSTTAENFHSPDTVCKYCGEDFKFFRALKHHLRSHSSCRQKPFLCMRCEVGFSTKANCVRHLQKQHPEVSQYQIEQYIHVNEPGNEDGEKSSLEGLSDDGLPADCRSTGTPMSSASIPPAHSTPKTSFQNDSRSQTPVSIKQEPADPDDCPLDFSVKSGSSTPTPTLTKSGTDELPMDLTVRKKEDSPVNSKVSGQAGVTYDNTLFQCQFCPMGFSDSRVLERHLWQNHPQVAEIIDKQMKPYLSGQGVNHLSSSPGKLKLPLKPPVPVSSDDKLKLMTKLSKGSPKSLKDVYKPMEARANSQNLDSGSDLASVKRILDAAKAQTFNALLNEDSGASCQSEEDSMDSMSNKDEDVLHIAEVNGESNGAVPIDADEPPVLSPRSKGDSVNTSEDSRDKDMPEISASPEHFAQLFSVPKEAIPKTVLDPTDKSAVRKKRNSYADSPHKLQCPYCTRTFPWVSSLTRHLLTHTGQKPFKCPRCPVTFSTKSNRERHLIRKHGVNMLDPLSRQTMDRPYKCHLCVFSSFSTQGNLLKHYKERHLGCDLPDTLSDLDKAVTKGLSTTIPPHERGLIQDISSKIAHDSYIRDNRLNDAEEQRTMNASLGKSPNVDISDLPFLMPEDVKSDIEDEEDDIIPLNLNTSREDSPKGKIFTGSGERQINPERDNYNVDKITSCWKCGEKFVSRKLLVRHLKEHNIDLPFKCYLCDASYEVRKECLGHQETAHMSDWKILKEKNKVDDVETFAKHMDKVVENNCNKVDQGAVLEIPGQNADDPKMEVVSADYMQRKVYCSLCPKRFWSLQDLRRHMRSHTGERPFECDICQKRFTLKHSMMRHRKKHLESGSLSASDDEDMPPIEETPAGAKVTHHRPILPRMKPIPVLPVSIITSLPSAISLNTTLNGETAAESSAGYSMTTPRPNATISSGSSATSTITVESDAKDNSADILHNLLGVDVGSIDQMLDSADSAAKLLGM